MNTLKKITLVLLLVVFCASAQTTTTSTTLSGSLNGTSTTLTLASSTGVSARTTSVQTMLYVDRELMAVQSNVSGNIWTVTRGQGGSTQSAHPNAAKVWVGPPAVFYTGTKEPAGSCTTTSFAYLPVIHAVTGNVWTCGNNQWTTFGVFGDRMTVGAQLTPAATLTITNPIQHITSSAVTVTTILAPALPATGGCVNLIPDANMTGFSTTTGNIALGTTLVLNKILTLCYDPTTAKWYPSY